VDGFWEMARMLLGYARVSTDQQVHSMPSKYGVTVAAISAALAACS